MPDYKKPTKTLVRKPASRTAAPNSTPKPEYKGAVGQSAADLFADIEDLTSYEPSRYLISQYGANGTGKTVMASTAPNCCILGLEDARDSLRGRSGGFTYLPLFKSVGLATPQTICDVVDHAESEGYESLCIDSLTKLGRHFLAMILKKDSEADLAENLKFSIATGEQWAGVADYMNQTISYIIESFSGNIIFNSTERIFNDDKKSQEAGLTPYTWTGVTPSTAIFLNSECGYVVNAQIRFEPDPDNPEFLKPIWSWLCGPHPNIRTKFRMPGEPGEYPCPEYIDNPTWAAFIAAANPHKQKTTGVKKTKVTTA